MGMADVRTDQQKKRDADRDIAFNGWVVAMLRKKEDINAGNLRVVQEAWLQGYLYARRPVTKWIGEDDE